MRNAIRAVLVATAFFALAATASAGTSYPEEISAVVDPYPGAGVLVMQRDGDMVQVILTAADPADKVMAHYKTALADKGWTVEREMAAGAVNGVALVNGDKRFLVSVMDNPGGGDPTMVTLSLEPK